MSQESFLPDDFDGTVRLFPLPNLVLFPHIAQPLHVFEPRYRELLADALDGDRLIAMALLRPGWEEDYHKQPPIHDVVCLGRILQDSQLPDGRSNLLLQGMCRARIIEEIPTDRLYRTARVELCPDEPVALIEEEQSLRRQLGAAVTPYFANQPSAMQQLQGLLESPLPLGTLCDLFCFALPLETEVKQQLLEECVTRRRVGLLLSSLDGTPCPVAEEPPRRTFPPGFSEN